MKSDFEPTAEQSTSELLNVAEWFALHGRNTNTAVVGICTNAADLIESLQAQLSETRLARNAQEAYKNHYKAQLAESQRREQAAVEDFADFIVEQGDCLRIALDTQDRHYLEQLISQWRGPQDGKGEAE